LSNAGNGGERLVGQQAGAGEGVEDVGVVDLLGLQVALGLRGGGGEREAAADAALGDAGAQRHQGERVGDEALQRQALRRIGGDELGLRGAQEQARDLAGDP